MPDSVSRSLHVQESSSWRKRLNFWRKLLFFQAGQVINIRQPDSDEVRPVFTRGAPFNTPEVFVEIAHILKSDPQSRCGYRQVVPFKQLLGTLDSHKL